jgi:hypothetical protein
VSPLDPQIFSTIAEHANDLLAGTANAKYSPIEVAQWMEDCAAAANSGLAETRQKTSAPTSPEFRRMEEDVLIQAGLGEFFAAKVRSAVLFEIFLRTGDTGACTLAFEYYQRARQAWATMANRAANVYVADIAYGSVPMRRGHWMDRLRAIDKDIESLAAKLEAAKLRTGPVAASDVPAERAAGAIKAAIGKPIRHAEKCDHTLAGVFRPGARLAVTLRVAHPEAVSTLLLHYRHVNQGERWTQMEMKLDHGDFAAEIPGDYTDSEFPLQYYFELRNAGGDAWLYPALNSTLSNQPYYAVKMQGIGDRE